MEYQSHRIICTGNFAASNNAGNNLTGTIEFTDYMSLDDILNQLKQIPLHPQYIDHHYSQYTYPIQNVDTRNIVKNLKTELSKMGFYMTGRFADWEYYNMDAAIEAAMKVCGNI